MDMPTVPLTVSVKNTSIVVKVDKKWLANHPLTDFSLHGEEEEWSKVNFDFELIPI
jgi:exopolyphosphatase/guanosine-5'-triphosphate,3'-diphosphate pyrophosphatase